jgi:formylmethanofuran dehydrogenase subunit B
MFQNLGRLLTEYYFPEEAVQIRQPWPRPGACPIRCSRRLRVPEGDVPHARRACRCGTPALDGARRQRHGRAMLSSDGEAQTAALHAAADQYAHVLGVPARQIVSATLESREQLRQLASAMGLQVAVGAPARRLLEATMTMANRTRWRRQPCTPTTRP